MQTLDEAREAMKRGEPIHISGVDAMRLLEMRDSKK